MSEAQPTVSIILPHYRDLANLDLCLTALLAQTYPQDRLEIVVADNNSPEGEAAVAAVIAGRAKLVVVAEKGAGPARNGGVAVSRGELLAFTDSDCRPDPDWVKEAVAALGEGYDIVGGAMSVLIEDPRRMTPCEAFETVFAFDNESYVKKKGFTVTANLVCPRTVFESVGGYRPAGIAEDLEWCRRAVGQGYRLGYAPRSIVGHPARRTWSDLLKKWRRANSDIFGAFMLENGSATAWLLRTFALPLSAVAHTPRALFSGKLPTLRDRLSATAILYRMRFWRFRDSLSLLDQHRKHSAPAG